MSALCAKVALDSHFDLQPTKIEAPKIILQGTDHDPMLTINHTPTLNTLEICSMLSTI